MIGTLSRRLRVRDDGTGKCSEIDAKFTDFETEDAIILLGDPGMGKTSLFRDIASANYMTIRNFLIDPSTATGGTLFLDALDEYRTIATGQDASAEVAKVLCSLKKPKFRLSCRAADWFGSPDQEVLRVASASGRVVVLELCPLSRDEILNAVNEIVPNPSVFLDEAETAGLGKLLGNPQTLELIARAWAADKKPRNKFEAYEIGVSELLKETNALHVVRSVTNPDLSDLRKAASAAATTILLSNSIGISRAEPADGNGYVRLPVVPHMKRADLDAVLRRRLFISSAVDRFEPIHRTIAEFLAAEDLSTRIANGLPINRVMALICGIDGIPIASLRGLFAWLMCKIGNLAEGYVERDPYGVATYGDASVLPPDAQHAIWAGLRNLRDPWFLTRNDDCGSFRDLANPNTAKIIHEVLEDTATGVHLKSAVLEAIANSTENIGLNAVIRGMVLEKDGNKWLRSTALKAFAKSVQNDWALLEALDCELAKADDDIAAPEVRVDLLRLTRAFGGFVPRLLSIMEQAISTKTKRRISGHFYPLIDLPSNADLDLILDGASRVLTDKSVDYFELLSLFDKWLNRRLESPTPITAEQLVCWLRNIRVGRDYASEKGVEVLKARFQRQPSLFKEVFALLSTTLPNKERSFWLFVAHDLWQLMPAKAWPIPQCEFFLACAENDNDPDHAAALFRMYLSWFPSEGVPVGLAEAGFDLLDCRPKLRKALGNWTSCKIEKWKKEESKRRDKNSRQKSLTRAKNVAFLTRRLRTIREGEQEDALVWAARVYYGLFSDIEDASDPHKRLVNLTNAEIADALIEGIIRYAESPFIPKKEAVIESWHANSIPYTHTLLRLSVFLRLNAGMTVPKEALPHCIAAAVTLFNVGENIPRHDEIMSEWLIQEARQNPAIVKSVLSEMWVSSTKNRKGDLPGFYDLSQDPGSQRFLTSLSADVLKAGINEDHETVCELVLVLLPNDQSALLAIGDTELARNELTAEVRAIWTTVLFVIDPSKYLESWRHLMSGPDVALWKAIEVIKGGRHDKKGAITLTSSQRAEVIASVGQRFADVGYPSSGWSGSENPWDASEFVSNQIKLLAADGSSDADALFERLSNDGGLASYRDLIRHQRAQHEKHLRESSFTFASPEQVSQAIQNLAPATSSDLLAFLLDHFGALSHELARTQRERYRAYWNENGHDLIKPKREEVCSGLLAEDLQNRVRPQNLIVTVEHHMIADKECDLMVLQGTDRLLPIEVKHHYHAELWTAWRTQLDGLYTRDAKAGGLGIYLVLWSGEAKGRMMPKLPNGLKRPTSAAELNSALESLIPENDRRRLRVVVIDISGP